MRQTIRLGRLLGIPIGMHWSVLVIMALLAQGLAMVSLPQSAPGSSAVVYWFMALAVTVVFLAGLLAHEAAHAVVARRFGVRVRRITLWLLGGVAELDGEAPNARGDLLIAAAGPLTSLLVSALFGFGLLGAAEAGAPDLTVAALAWLTVVNLALALFNLLPGAPLDGGRVLRAVIWWIGKDRLAAQRVAGLAGMLLGGLMSAAGVGWLLFAANLGGLWLMLLGWFLIAAARSENLGAQVQTGLAGIRVADVMSLPPVHGLDSQTAEAFILTVARHHPHRVYPVLGTDGRPTGLISLARLQRVPAPLRSTQPLSEIQAPMTTVMLLDPGAHLADVAPGVLAGGHRLALVVVDGQLVGVLCATDITRSMELVRLGALPARSGTSRAGAA